MTRFPWPDDIDPSEVEGIAEACDRVGILNARHGNYDLASDLMSAARLLRLLETDLNLPRATTDQEPA